jgi:hypothetical protein
VRDERDLFLLWNHDGFRHRSTDPRLGGTACYETSGPQKSRPPQDVGPFPAIVAEDPTVDVKGMGCEIEGAARKDCLVMYEGEKHVVSF